MSHYYYYGLLQICNYISELLIVHRQPRWLSWSEQLSEVQQAVVRLHVGARSIVHRQGTPNW